MSTHSNASDVCVLPLILTVLAAVAQAQDTTPLQLRALSFSPSSIDTSRGPANVSVNATVTDSSSGVSYMEITFVDPSGTFVRRGSATFSPARSVSSLLTVTFPQAGVSGTWTVGTVFLADKAGNTQILNPDALAGAGFPTNLLVTSVSDTTPPRLINFAITPSPVDTASAPANVNVNFTASDDLSGINVFQVFFVSPTGSSTLRGAVSLTPTTSASGSATVTFPQFSEPGAWTVGGLFLADAAGNTLVLDSAGLEERRFPTTFTVKSKSDSTPPTLGYFHFAPTSIDISGADVNVTVSFQLTDDLSGATTFQAAFLSPSGAVTETAATSFVPGTTVNSSTSVKIPRGGESGTWTVTRVFLADAVGNTRILTIDDLAAQKFPTQLTVTNRPLTQPLQ
jgi:hypothetical protein